MTCIPPAAVNGLGPKRTYAAFYVFTKALTQTLPASATRKQQRKVKIDRGQSFFEGLHLFMFFLLQLLNNILILPGRID
jgi:hypothetical protein